MFAVSGFSALTLQVVWQRVISLHAGVDLASITTVVSAFLAGLGVGSVLGGVLADRLGPRRSLLAFALANAGIGAFAYASIWLFYGLYRSVVPSLDGALASFAFHFALLIVPTTLMGLSLPLASSFVERIEDAAPLVGRLYAICFPHVMRFSVSYDGSQFFIASQQPIVFDRQQILERLQALNPTGAFSAAQVASIREFLLTVEPVGARSGEPAAPTTEDRLNRDLAPRDEYFLNNPP